MKNMELTEELLEEIQEFHKHKLPDPEQYPIIFEYMIKMFMFSKNYKKSADLVVDSEDKKV